MCVSFADKYTCISDIFEGHVTPGFNQGDSYDSTYCLIISHYNLAKGAGLGDTMIFLVT